MRTQWRPRSRHHQGSHRDWLGRSMCGGHAPRPTRLLRAENSRRSLEAELHDYLLPRTLVTPIPPETRRGVGVDGVHCQPWRSPHPCGGQWDCEASTGMPRHDARSRGSLLPAMEIGLVGAPGTGWSSGQLRADGKTPMGARIALSPACVSICDRGQWALAGEYEG